MKALVTGGAGFIGSHLAQALVQRGHEVVVLDNFSLGFEANLAWATGGNRVRIVTGDIRDDASVAGALAGCDWVFHEAAMPSVPRSVQLPVETNAVNLDATLRLLVAARDAKVSRFVFASSSSVYGDTAQEFKREDLPPNPLSPYALQKYGSERYGQLFWNLYSLPTVSLRYFNVFGSRQSFNSPYSGVIARFCTAFNLGQALTIHGDGTQSRDFTYVDNVIDANLQAAEAPLERVAGRVFNIACGDSISLLDLVGALRDLTGHSPEITFQLARAGDVRHSRADISAAQAALGFSPMIDWRTGLGRTLNWYRQVPPVSHA